MLVAQDPRANMKYQSYETSLNAEGIGDLDYVWTNTLIASPGLDRQDSWSLTQQLTKTVAVIWAPSTESLIGAAPHCITNEMKENAFVNGEEFPALEAGKLRIYSMRFCPYAQRTKLVLAHKNIPHETVNINLKSKPSWFLEKTPWGLVPVLEQNDKIVYESAICNDYLDAAFPGPSLTPSDPYTRARHAITMEMFSKALGLSYKLFRSSKEDRPAAKEDFNNALQVLEDSIEGKFFGGDQIQMVDFHMWPFFERWYGREGMLNSFPKLQAWVALMLEQPAVKATAFSPEEHAKYIESYVKGKPEYDMGLN